MFGVVEVTFRLPAEIEYTPAIPRTALAANWNVVPLIVTLYKLAVPFNVLELMKVAVPAVAVNDPVMLRRLDIVKFVEVVIVPVIESP